MSRSGYTGPKLPRNLLEKVQNNDSRFKNTSRNPRRKIERQQKQTSGPPRTPGRPVARRRHVEEESEKEDDSPSPEPAPKRSAKARLVDDEDAEIAALEKKLGIKGKKSKILEDDGLDWLAEGSESGSGDEGRGLKRKRPEDVRWLQDKRLKVVNRDDGTIVEDIATSESELLEQDSDVNEIDSDDFEGFESDEADQPPKKQRENPYVAPVSRDAAPAGKYIPPSMRKAAASDEEALHQLRRQVKGLLNRLSEANLLSILQSLEDLYTRNPRQHVTSSLIELLVGLVSDPSILNDTFLILHAGFAEAVYKIIGTDFGAQLLEKIVGFIDRFRSSSATDGKQTLNLLAFLSCLYNFQLAGSAILFDYIRLLLDELTETNTELLLRIIRTSGQQLRQDDPSALKDIVLLLQRLISRIGEDQLSVRTKFMIETIHNLKNNRMKAGAAGSALAAEHTNRMKKMISSMNSTRSIKATEPLRISLADIRDTEKKGKWWLVGASYHGPSKLATSDQKSIAASEAADAAYESENPDSVNLNRLAREQGMNTSIRRAIFITVMSSVDCVHAHMRLLKLNLKKKQMDELPRVLVHCVMAEEAFNPYYVLVARKFCNEHRTRKAFHFTLWDVLKRIEASGEDDDDEQEPLSIAQLYSVGSFYGWLIADQGLNLAVLKKLDPNLITRSGRMVMFVEVLLTRILMQVRKIHSKKDETEYERAVGDIFMSVPANIIPGLTHVLENKVSKAELTATKKERRAVEKGWELAVTALKEVT
jgi:nucleolar MIF4G domain-containing protein 1